MQDFGDIPHHLKNIHTAIGMDREIHIRLGVEIAEARGFHSAGLVFRSGGGLILKFSGIVDTKGLQVRSEYDLSLDLLKGYFLHLNSASRNEWFRIRDVDVKDSVLYIEDRAGQVPIGQTLIVDSGEPMPLMAVRLLSGTGLEELLPSCNIQIEIDRSPPEGANYVFILITSLWQSGYYRGFPFEHLQVREQIGEKGEILESLAESEINRVLRKVFQNSKAVIYIKLQNSGVNPVHEKALMNLLRAAGYEKTYASHMSDSILHILPYLEKDFTESFMTIELDKCIQEVRESLSTDSSLNLIL